MFIYLSHNFGNNPENVKHLEEEVKEIVRKYGKAITKLRVTFISPLHGLGFLYDKVEYNEGMRMCLSQLKICNLMIVFDGYDNSKGVMIEKQFCKDNRIPIIKVGDFKKLLEEIQPEGANNV